MLPEQLTAAAARHQDGSRSIDAGKSDQPPAATGMERRNQPTLCAQGRPYEAFSTLQASHPSVVDQRRRTDRKVRVRRVRVAAGRNGGGTQPVPVDGDRSLDRFRAHALISQSAGSGTSSFSNGMPSAAGGLTRPTSPPQR